MRQKEYERPEIEDNEDGFEFGCRYNERGVTCYQWNKTHDKSICINCGRHPVVNEIRRRELRKKFGGGSDE